MKNLHLILLPIAAGINITLTGGNYENFFSQWLDSPLGA
jgi:hypothetical protein